LTCIDVDDVVLYTQINHMAVLPLIGLRDKEFHNKCGQGKGKIETSGMKRNHHDALLWGWVCREVGCPLPIPLLPIATLYHPTPASIVLLKKKRSIMSSVSQILLKVGKELLFPPAFHYPSCLAVWHGGTKLKSGTLCWSTYSA
jgi:hypothetical protein